MSTKDSRALDEADRRILRALQQDARLTISQIAERVGLSQTPCWNRLKRLERDGFIESYVAILNQEKLGYPETVMIEIVLDRHDEEVLDRCGKRLQELPEVLEVWLTSGQHDYFVKVAVEGTAGYERFLREKLYKIPGIRQTRSSFALRCLKQSTSVPA